MTVSTPVLEPILEADRDECSCCHARTKLRRDIEAWWQPKSGFGYGTDCRLITLCEDCILTLQFFVEVSVRGRT